MPSGWGPFLEDGLLALGLSTAAILSKSGEPLAVSPGLQLRPATARKLVAALEGVGAAEREVLASGFRVNGSRYAVARIENDDSTDMRVLLGRCKDPGSPSRGVIVCMTTQALIVAVHDPLEAPDLSFGRTNVAVTVLADTLIAQNY